MSKYISSVQNPLIKEFIQLREKSRSRKKSNAFVLEGAREIGLALKGNYQILTWFFCPEIVDENLFKNLVEDGNITDTVEIPKNLYEKMAYRGTTEGVLAIGRAKELTLERLSFDHNHPLVLVAEAPEKPGNIGALLRTADAAKLDAVIIANPKTDLYNPNIIRSSVGCIFTTAVASGTTSEIISFLKEKNIRIFGAALQASVPYHTVDFKEASAIVVGTEDSGLSESWLQAATQNIIIPMQGEIDSMNVSVAAGILIFEAKRQRDFKS